MKLLRAETQFSNDIGMAFRESKCVYQSIQTGKQKILDEPIQIDG